MFSTMLSSRASHYQAPAPVLPCTGDQTQQQRQQHSRYDLTCNDNRAFTIPETHQSAKHSTLTLTNCKYSPEPAYRSPTAHYSLLSCSTILQSTPKPAATTNLLFLLPIPALRYSYATVFFVELLRRTKLVPGRQPFTPKPANSTKTIKLGRVLPKALRPKEEPCSTLRYPWSPANNYLKRPLATTEVHQTPVENILKQNNINSNQCTI